MPILYASKKYLIPGLTKVCVEYLEKQLSGDNACILYDHSLLFEETKLSERSLLMIKNKTEECLKAPSFSNVRQSTLSKILDADRLTAPEIDVFSACERWARYQVEQSGKAADEVTGEAMRKVLGDCVFKIRYPTLTFKDFGTIVAPSAILLAEEENSLFRFFASEKEISLPQKFQIQNRFLKGPFIATFAEDCTQASKYPLTTTFELTSNQTITIKSLRLGAIQPGYDDCGDDITLTCTNMQVNDSEHKVVSVTAGKTPAVHMKEEITLCKDIKVILQMTLKPAYSDCYIESYPKLSSATTREISISDATTGLNVSVSSDNNMSLMGFQYDYDYM